MNILVTVGTKPFDLLIAAADQQFSNTEFSVTCQIASGSYQPEHHPYIHFTNSFSELIASADIVITHGGAATVFELLEAGKKIVLVPNSLRTDNHQKDMASYVEHNQYGIVCRSLNGLVSTVKKCSRTKFNAYAKDQFFMGGDILEYFDLPFQK